MEKQFTMLITLTAAMLGSAKATDLGLLEQQIARLKTAFPCHISIDGRGEANACEQLGIGP
jgi:hypothetical protein